MRSFLKRLRLSSRYILLFVVMAAVSQWMILKLYLSSLGQKQQILTEIKDSPLIELIESKTNLKLHSFRMVASPRLYAAMIGIPGRPYMVLSSRLNDEFSDSEKEYVVLHEIGHYLLHHSIKESAFFLILFIIGCLIVRSRSPLIIPVIGVVFGLLYIQFGMRSEYEADNFSVTHITDPRGMISATEKFKNAHDPPLDDYSPMWPLLYRSTPYHERVNMAEEEIKTRVN